MKKSKHRSLSLLKPHEMRRKSGGQIFKIGKKQVYQTGTPEIFVEVLGHHIVLVAAIPT